MIRPSTIWAAIKVSPFILFAQFTWLRKYSKHPEKAPIEYRYQKVHKLIKRVVHVLKLDIKVNHYDYMINHKETYLGISNHRNFFDPLFFIYLSEKPISFVAKKEAFDIPFVSRVMKTIEAFSIDRDDVIGQVRLFKDISEKLKENKISYYIFAEGTRMKIKEQIHTLPYKDGAIKPAYWSQKDIIFVSTYGSHMMWDKKPRGFKKKNITIEFHPVLYYQDFKDKPTTKVTPMIEEITNQTLIKIAKENSVRNLK